MNYKEATLFSWAVMILIFALTYTTTTTIIKNLFLPPLLRPLNATGTFYAYIFFIRIPQRFSNFFYLQNKWLHRTKNSTFNPHISFVANLRLELNISIIIFQITLSSSDSSSKWNISFFLSLIARFCFDIFSHKSLSVCHLLLFSCILVSLFMRSLSVTQST